MGKKRKERDGIIYKYTNKINGKSYIGLTVDFKRRHNEHNRSSKNKNATDYNGIFHKAIRKYGINKFKKEILNTAYESQLPLLEKFYINKFKTNASLHKDAGYNMTMGGECLSGCHNPNYDSTIYTFYHYNGTVITCTQSYMRDKFGLSSSGLSRLIHKHSKCNGWSLEPFDLYSFISNDGVIVKDKSALYMGNMYEPLARDFNRLISNNYKSCRGWRLYEEG